VSGVLGFEFSSSFVLNSKVIVMDDVVLFMGGEGNDLSEQVGGSFELFVPSRHKQIVKP
jgi:hypothetical protein